MNPEPLDVVILNDHASLTGGSAAVALAAARGLAARSVRVTYLAGTGPVDPALAATPGVTIHCLDQAEIGRDRRRWRAAASGLVNVNAARALRAVLAGKSPARTVVHAHSWTKVLSPWPLATAAREGFRLFVTLHDYFMACPNGGFFVYPSGQICQRRPLSASCLACDCDRRRYAHKLWRSARTALQNGVLALPRRTSCFVGVSDYSLGIMRPYLPAGARTRVVRNPVDAPDEGPAPVADNREFLFVGRFEFEKGAGLFAEAARRANVPATFVGDGALMPELRKLCPRGEFTGWLSPPEIRRRLRRARAIVFPSLWHETLGLVVVEAAAAGVPAIVSDRCAAADLVRDGETGLHFAHGSPDSLASQMQAMNAPGARAGELGRAAYAWYWNDPWTTDRHVESLLELYGFAPDPPAEATVNHEGFDRIRAGP